MGFFLIFIALGIGYAVGEAVSAATNRKRATALQACAVGGVVLAFLVRNLIWAEALVVQGDPWGYLAAGFAAFYAASRVRG
jgi:hypothetical protein